MAKKFRGGDWLDEVEEALDKGMRRFLITTQGKLAAANPVDTGRMASSWLVGKGGIDTRVDQRTEKGPVTVRPPTVDLDFGPDYYISNSLPYAERVALDPVYAKGGRRGGADWFSRIENRLPKDAERAFDFFFKKIK